MLYLVTNSLARIRKGGLLTNPGLRASYDVFRWVSDQGSDNPWSETCQKMHTNLGLSTNLLCELGATNSKNVG